MQGLSSYSGVGFVSAVFLIVAPSLASQATAQTPSPDKTAVPAVSRTLPIARTSVEQMKGGSSVAFHLKLESGQYIHVEAMQHGIDIALALYAPNGAKLAEHDSPNGTSGPECLSWVAKSAGDYRVEIHSDDPAVQPGRVDVTLTDLRPAVPADDLRLQAEAHMVEAATAYGNHAKGWITVTQQQYDAALSLWTQIDDKKSEVDTLDFLTRALNDTGGAAQSIALMERALPIASSLHDGHRTALVLNERGIAFSYTGENQRALDDFLEERTILESINDGVYDDEVAYALSNIGFAYENLGREREAIDMDLAAVKLFVNQGDRTGAAVAWSNAGGLYDLTGQYSKAIDAYEGALALTRTTNATQADGLALSNLGLVYKELGESAKAESYYQQALQRFHDLGDLREEATITMNLARIVLDDQKDYSRALEMFNRSLALSREVHDRGGEVSTLDAIAATYHEQGKREDAIATYTQAAKLAEEIGDRSGLAVSLQSIGTNYIFLDQQDRALPYLERALAIAKEISQPEKQADTLFEMAFLYNKTGDLPQARVRIESAISLIEGIRANIPGQGLRTSYFALMQKFYDLDIEILMRLHARDPYQGLAAAALQAKEHARARSLLEMLAEAHADIRKNVDPALLDQERSLKERLAKAEQQQSRFLTSQPDPAQAQAAAKDIEHLAAEYERLQSEIRTRSPRYAALTQPTVLDVAAIQHQLLDSNTLLLEYSLGERHSYLWVVSSNGFTSVELPPRDVIEAQARKVHALLRSQGNGSESPEDLHTALLDVSRTLLVPIAPQLGSKRLVIVADGAMEYIPFASLHDPAALAATYQPLIVAHDIVNLPSASTLAVLREETRGRKSAPWVLGVFADPVFDVSDPRVARSDATVATLPTASSQTFNRDWTLPTSEEGVRSSGYRSIPRLTFTRREADAILALAPVSKRSAALDFAANKEAVTGDGLSRYRILHFATHGFLNSEHPELSGLLLSLVDNHGQPEDGFLRTFEIFNLDLHADLVVLSACQTGLGKSVRGEGVVGMTRAFMYAGAPRVIVSLWSVDDEATAALMTEFYRQMLGPAKLPPAAALRQAQISLLKSERWSSPYYWAPFILQGDWK